MNIYPPIICWFFLSSVFAICSYFMSCFLYIKPYKTFLSRIYDKISMRNLVFFYSTNSFGIRWVTSLNLNELLY